MTALGLTLAGLAPGLFSAFAYWLIHAAIRERRASAREMEALASSPGGQAFARALRPLATLELARPEPEHIAVLKLRAAALVDKLHNERRFSEKHVVEKAVENGDREAMEALLRAVDSP